MGLLPDHDWHLSIRRVSDAGAGYCRFLKTAYLKMWTEITDLADNSGNCHSKYRQMTPVTSWAGQA